jgi:hypothetical protein
LEFDGKPVNSIVRIADGLEERVARPKADLLHAGYQSVEEVQMAADRFADDLGLPRL